MARAYRSTGGTTEVVRRAKNGAIVELGPGYLREGAIAVMMEDTGNGLIARFAPSNSTEQAYYVCLDYSQARLLALALSAFQGELGFKDKACTKT